MDPINTFLTTTCIVTVATVVAVTLIARSRDNLRRETEARDTAREDRRKKQLAAELERVKPQAAAPLSSARRRSDVVEAGPVKLTVNLKEILAEAVPRASLSRAPVSTGYVPPAPRANEPDVITPIVVTSLLMADSNRDYSPAPAASCDSGSSSYDSGSSSSSCGSFE